MQKINSPYSATLNPYPPYQQNNSQGNALLQQILDSQRLTTLATEGSESTLKKQLKLDQIRFFIFVAIVFSVLIYIASVYISIKTRYSFMIGELSKIPSASYGNVSPWYVAFAYEYPGLDIRFVNKNFPAAVVYAYYTKEYQQAMEQNQSTIVPQMFEFATNGANKGTPPLAQTIVCNALQTYVQDPKCENNCPGPINTPWYQYASQGLSLATSGIFIGMTAGAAAGPGGAAFGALVGFLIGAGAGVGIGFGKQSSINANCQQNIWCVNGVDCPTK